MEQTISVQARQTASDFMAMQVRADLEASATATIPETARLRRTATREAPPTRMGRPRTNVSLLRTQPSTHSCRGRSALLMQHPCSRCRRRRRTESLNPSTQFVPGVHADQANGTETPTALESGSGGEKAPKGSRRPRRGAGAARSAGCGSGAEAMPLLSSMPFAQRGSRGEREQPQAGTATGGRRLLETRNLARLCRALR